MVNNAEVEVALGGGWADSPAEWVPYKGPRRASPQHDPVKWVDEWSVQGISEGHREMVEVELLKAASAFWDSRDAPNADTRAMRCAFNGIAQTLFEAGLLTEQLLEEDIPSLVWDSAIAGGWWRLASETRPDMFPERRGHYWVWCDDSRDWKTPFRAETSK